MQFSAKAKFVRYSPYKLRPLADVIRGKNAQYALHWLETYKTRRSVPLKKMLMSAVANAKNLNELSPNDLVIKDLRIDEGPIIRYYKPGAMGRANIQRKRLCHLSVILERLGK
ncbi:MAG TPA: 50S ribosomal protein L22 [Candidatus Babeliales bacterium]|nr:50S ribosomal protein L22 [Candidatus Dependentiae bacterium]HEX2977791.1 50S ribosomal protein L22 [Candidatus Babeliales bacterium]